MVINARDLPEIFAEWAEVLMAWKDYKTFGLPYSGGYMQHPAMWVNTMRILEAESATWMEEQRKPKGK